MLSVVHLSHGRDLNGDDDDDNNNKLFRLRFDGKRHATSRF